MKSVRNRWLAGLGVVVLLVGLLFIGRHDLIRFALERAIGSATGYSVTIGDQRLGIAHGALLDVRVSRNDQPVLAAQRIDLYYSLRDLLPGSTHRYGLTGVTIDHPTLTVVRNADRTLNLILPTGNAPPGVPGRPDPVPLHFTVRLRNGSAQVAYGAPKPTIQRVDGVQADATIDSSARTHYVVTGAFEDTAPEPFRLVGAVDVQHGYAIHHLRAAAIPIRAIGNFIIDAASARILAGTAHDVDAKTYALDVTPAFSGTYHSSVRLDVDNGQMYFSVLAKPLTNIRGRLQIVDDALFARGLAARLAGVPVAVEGGIFDFAQPQVRLGISGTGDLQHLREVLAFARKQPVSGAAHVGVLLEGPLSAIVVVAHLDAADALYRALPLHDAHADIALSHGTVLVSPLRAEYGGIAASVRGSLVLGKTVHSNLVVHAGASGVHFPYLDEILPKEPMVADALLAGSNLAIGAHGSFASARDVARAGGMFSFDADGVADVSPLYVDGGNGTFYGRYVANRRIGTTTFWLDAANLTVTHPAVQPFPGAGLPRLPNLDGRIASLSGAGAGSATGIDVAGRASANGLTIADVRFDALSADFAGDLKHVNVDRLQARGPWGRFAGVGAFSTKALLANGNYSGTLEGLHPFLGSLVAHGALRGPVTISIGDAGVIVQSSALRFAGARVHGVPITRIDGTVAFAHGIAHVYSASADIAGGRVTAAGSYGPSRTLQMTGVGLHGDDVRALGLPLDGGTLSLAGAWRGGGKVPAFTGGLVVQRGRSQGYRVQGTAVVAMQAGTMRVERAVASLGAAYGIVDGSIGNIGGGEPTYALHADVPAADIDDALSTLHVPSYRTQGVFNARLAIGGSGARPSVTGTIGVPGGEVNGLPFVDAHAQVSAHAKSVRARAGSVRVGSTELTFFAQVADGDQSVGLRAPAARFSDFDNFFDTGDTLDGNGAVWFAAVDSARRVATRGSVNVRAFRYRRLPVGDTVANWSSHSNLVSGTLAVGGAHGALRVAGSIGLSRAATLAGLVARSRYNVNATLANLDLSTWLPALGYPEVPLLGRVNGSARVSGTYPYLAVTSAVSLAGGSFARLPIDTLTASVVTRGDLLELRAVQLQAPGLTASAIGSVGLRPGAPVRVSVHASSSDVPTLVAQVAKRHVDVTGTFETTLNVGGTLAVPTFDAAFDAQNVEAFGVPVVSLFGSARMNGPALELSDIGVTFAQGQATLAGTLPLQLQPFGLGPAKRPISFDLALQNVDPAAFDALLGSNTKLGGALDGHVGLSGTLQAPRVFGQVRLHAGSYVSALERAPVTNAAATVEFDGTSAKLSAFQARFGAGSVAGTGSAGFVTYGGRADELQYALHVKAAGAQIDLPAYGTGTLDATLDLVRAPPTIASLRGTMALSEATIPFSAFGGFGKGGDAGTTARRVPDMRLDLAVTAGKNVRVRGGGVGAGLDIGATGKVAVAGTLDAPSLDGKFSSTGGTLTYFDRAFRMQSGQVVFTPGDGLQPTLHAVAATNITNPDPDRARNPYGSADITIKVDGPLNNLGFSFTSNPPGYTRDQIIALLAPFGGFANTISFDPNAGGPPLGGGLPGGIPVPTGQPIPGVLVQSENGTITVGQEAFNILNAQFTSGLLAPVETILGQELGLENLSLTVDYYGNVGVNVHRGVGKHLNAVYASTFGIPQTESFGLQYAPSDRTAAQLTFFFTNGPTALIAQPRTASGNLRVTTGEALQGQNGFAFTLQRFF